MATLHTVAPPAAQTVRGIEVENRFFVGMSLLLLATAPVGFAKSYFLAGLVRAPLPNKLIHFHALLFSCWILLLLTGFDLWYLKRIHRATLAAGLLSIVMLPVAIPIGSTARWIAFADWMLKIARTLKG
jgi:hypothetical protein